MTEAVRYETVNQHKEVTEGRIGNELVREKYSADTPFLDLANRKLTAKLVQADAFI